MTSKENSNLSVREYTVRIAKNTDKKYNIMAFNAGDRVDSSTWTQAQMERDMSARQFSEEQKVPEGRAGSEFGKKQCGESRRKTFGIEKREFKAEDQPWILNVNGKEGRRFKGQKRGGVTEHASYYIFKKTSEGEFEIFPVNSWYNFTPISKHRTLTAEEAEEKWSRRNKVVNHFNIMIQQRLQDDQGEKEEEESEESGKKKKGGGKGGDLRIHDLEEELEMSSEDSDWSVGEEGENKKPKKTSVKGKGKKKKRKDDSEALEDSDDGDYEGLEMDYMSDESSSEEEPEKENPNKGENVPKGIDEMSESEEESEEEKQNCEESEEEEEKEEGKKTDSSGESDSFDDSDIEAEATSALLMKKRIPPKLGGGPSTAGSSRTGSRPGTLSIDSASTSNTLRASTSKLQQGKRQAPGPDCPPAKRLKMEPSSQSPGPSGKSTPQPPSGKSTPSSSDIQLVEKVIQRSLTQRPMTTKDILKKFQTKLPGLSNEQTLKILQQIMKQLKPERKVIDDKMHFYLMKSSYRKSPELK